ncbi:MAG: glycoside hydrolase [Armatimonadetes bacterium]|nr:glycoside hydrolase [Armatimonadota bacterium]
MFGILAILGYAITTSIDMGFTTMVAPATNMFPRNTEGSIVELKDGRLLLAWTQFYGGTADNAGAVIAGVTSSDGGRSWSKPFLLQENVGKCNVMSVSLLRLKSGRIGMFYLVKNSLSDLQVYARYSSDEGKTWGSPVRITPDEGYNVMNNDRVIQLSSGRILAPIAYTPDISKPTPAVSFVLYSDDEGRTWRKSSPDIYAPKRGAMEPGVVELADGRVLMIIRTQTGRIYHTYSYDGGAHWEEAKPMCVVSPESPASIKRIPGTGDLLLVWNNNFEPEKSHGGIRNPLTVGISRDGGKTWTNIKNIESAPGKSWAYTSILFLGKDVLLTYYETENWADGLSLKFRSIPLEWLYQP